MSRLRIGTNNIDAIDASAGLFAGKKPTLEVGDSSNGSLRLGLMAVSAIDASAGLLAGKKPTLEIGDSANGSLRVNVASVTTLANAAGILGGKKPTLEIGIPTSESGYDPPVALELIRTGLNHWLIDVLGGTYMQEGKRGNLDGAVFVVNASGKVVIPQSVGGDKVIDDGVRGVWLTTVGFSWDGFNSDPDEGAVNYYSSHVIVGTDCEITLSPALSQGTQVQVYYFYSGTQQLGRLTYYGSSPYLYKSYGGPFPEEDRDKIAVGAFSSAVDAEYWYIVACHEAYLATSDSTYNNMANAIIAKCREYETVSGNYLNTFDSALFEKPDGVWAKSEFGDLTGVIDYDPVDSNNKVLKISGAIGTWGGWGNWEQWNFTGSPNFKFKFRGQNLTGTSTSTTGIFKLRLKKTDDTEWIYNFADTSTSWKTYNVALSEFKDLSNIVFGDLNDYWWSIYGKAAIAATEINSNQMDGTGNFWGEGSSYHYLCARLEYNFDTLPFPLETYDGAGFITGVPVACTVQTDNLNFYVYTDSEMNLRVKLKDTADNSYEYTQYLTTGSTRVSINLTAFTPSASGTFDQVQFILSNSGVYPNEIIYPDKSIGSIGGSWSGGTVGGDSTISVDYSNHSIIQPNERTYLEVVTASVTIAGYDGYAGFLVAIPTGNDSSRYNKLSFVLRTNMTQDIKITLRDNNSNDHIYWLNIVASETTRHNIAFSSFDGGAIAHPVDDVRFGFYDIGTSKIHFGEVRFGDNNPVEFPAKIFLTDIKFGSSISLSGVTEIDSYAFFWSAVTSGSSYSITTYWDDVGIDYSPPDDYFGLPYKSYQWSDNGDKSSYMGPLYLGYLVPAAYYFKGYTTEAALAAQCIRDAQVEFTSRMGRSSNSLFMPCHTRALAEGADYSDTNESNIFSFGKPTSKQMEWGGWQYRIGAQLAHYYYLTGNTNAQNALDDIVAWLDTAITEDPVSSGIWRIPTTVKREGIKIKTTASIGASSITLKGCPTSDSEYFSGDWVDNKDILYIQNDSTKYTITAAASPDVSGEVTVTITPSLVAQADGDEKVLILETTTGGVHEKGAMAQMFIYHYWKSGNALSQTWYRRILDDLINNLQEANGSFMGGSSTYPFHQAEVAKCFGMLINGRLGATPTYSLSATSADETAFQAVYDYMVDNIGSAKPCSIGLDWLPVQKYEDYPEVVEQGASISNTAGTTEGISLCMHFALDYARYSGDYTWLNRLKEHLYYVTIGE